MAIMTALDSTIFATDRFIDAEVFINGELIPSGLDEEATSNPSALTSTSNRCRRRRRWRW